MSRLTKAEREQVRQMFGGRCAYCGTELTQRWHADHFNPVRRDLAIVQTERGYRFKSGPPTRPEFDVFENFMPSCVPCNIDKHAMDLEAWRKKLSRTLDVLNGNYPTYRHARRFGLLIETPAPIIFYFERVAADAGGAGASQ
ncbi:HNH endonuclease [Burkholderia stagnalis]|uniref:HNH endonuclease n=1 Tax=Burkholderia stagnalis TaxID=1503054 RepID=UPI000F5F88BE|nr:HNH endonuclease [Burkholderia stagnalis]TCW78696.1 HNH endonuclease [Burkholderia sp. SRS-46]RQX94991.1 HNH endonuclease [Burkholderia stagnalis]RQY32544.1 HNH endonuclease [Burkholderia stagnalis]RQY49615.1 HNH endonuclease [Burkholderia stagnalis]RQY56586.1 HNH endonuclease [Burkholderia stagnalis]